MDDRRLPPEYLSRYSGAASRLPQLYPIEVPKTPETPVVPASESPQRKPTEIPWYNPQGWSFRKRLIAVCAIVIIIVVVVVGTVEGVRANRYPNYTPLTYQLRDTYAGPSFFDQFRYFSDADPTDGFVVYVNKKTAQDLNLTYATESSAVLRVDSFTPNAIAGRNSVRVESLHTYDTGLFIFDIIHTPHGCATWPALWLTDGDNWPNNGEIDILESNNEGSHGNEVTLHTTPGCRMDVKRKGTGDPRFVTCDNSTHGNAGCGVQGDPSTYGHLFNVNGGGVYALELRKEGIRAWFFPRESIPSDISLSKSSTSTSPPPNPATWGIPLADFPSTECDIPSHFRNQSIIVNIDLCGELASQPQHYNDLYHCPTSCHDFVARNPRAFQEAYWEFGSFRVYEAV